MAHLGSQGTEQRTQSQTLPLSAAVPRRRHHGSMSFPCNSCKHPTQSLGSSSSCWPPIEILTLLRNPAQSLSDKTDICYHKAGQPVPKGQLQAALKGLCKAERGFLTAEASKKAAPTQEADGPLCLFHPYTFFFLPDILSDPETLLKQHRGSNSAWKFDLLIVLGIYTPS